MAARSEFTTAVLRAGRVVLETHPLPLRATGEVDVAIDLAAICGSDLHTVSGRRFEPDGTALGHEAVGHVVACDDGTSDARGHPVAVGDRVVFGMIAFCGDCDRCLGGLPMKCRSLFKYGHAVVEEPPHAVGMLADLVRLRATVTVLLAPRDVPNEALVSAPCAVPTAAAGLRPFGPVLPDAVTVIGAGAVGCYAIGMLADAGVKVSVMEPRADRRTAAEAWGAIPVVSLPPDVGGIIDASGSAAAVGAAITDAPVGATIVLLGSVSPGRDPITVDPADIVRNRLQIYGIHNYAPDDVVSAVDWIAARGAAAPHLVVDPFGLSDITEAFDAAFAGASPRIGVRPDGS